MRFGQDPVAFLKPGDDGGLMEIAAGGNQGGGVEPMVFYDYVEDNKRTNVTWN